MNKAYLLTGGNIGDRVGNLEQAIKLIRAHCGTIKKASSIYETAAWGKNDQPPFLNQALEIQTGLSPHQLLKQVLTIENSIGRIRKEKYGPRSIDIDILFYNDEILNHPQLTLPHPEIQNRGFVLVPLAEIAGALVHPILQKTIAQLLAICPDKLEVSRIN